LDLTIHQLDEFSIDSKYPDFVKLCPYLTKNHFNRIPYYDDILHPGKNHHLNEIHHLDESHQFVEI